MDVLDSSIYGSELLLTIACDLGTFDESDRLQYRDLAARVRSAFIARSETSDGFVFELRLGGISSAEITEWISMERRCCPFLSIELSTCDQAVPADSDAGRRLTMSGPAGIKELILTEFPFS